MKSGKVSAFNSWTSDAEATAAAPISPKAMFLKLRILAAETKRLPRTGCVSRSGDKKLQTIFWSKIDSSVMQRA